MSGMGGGSGGGGGSGSSGGDGVAQELAEVRAKIEKLEKATEEQQQKIDAEQDKDERRLMRESLAADKQRLVELQKEKNRLAEQLQREQQPQAAGSGMTSETTSLLAELKLGNEKIVTMLMEAQSEERGMSSANADFATTLLRGLGYT